jgi:polar amino acid transport system substrate-binding protein
MKLAIRTISAAAGLGILATASLQPAMADGSLERVKIQGYVVTAVNQELPYAELKSDGSLVGVLPEVVETTLREAGIGEFRGVLIDWGAMIPGLQARRFDLVSGGLYINPKRCGAILFSEPILCDAEGFLAKNGNPTGVASYADLIAHPTARAAACPGCYEHMAAKRMGLSEDRIVPYDGSIQNGVQLVRTGRADVLLTPMASAQDLMTKMDDLEDFELVGPLPDLAGGCAAIGFNGKDRELRDAFDAGLKKLQDSGEFDAILAKYGANPDAVRVSSRTALCEGVAN